ncbi:hypothetical protein KM043_003664 [Ampulex compressa]|nr:hypothetical protein KM043_003664 [Ampulex compressa]
MKNRREGEATKVTEEGCSWELRARGCSPCSGADESTKTMPARPAATLSREGVSDAVETGEPREPVP